MHLLVVEDERALCETIVRDLRRLAYSVDFCHDGEEALELLYTEHYDLVLLDLNLPGKDGMTVLRTLRQTDHETRVLILSARSGVEDKVAGLDAGANDYLAKPFSFAELSARVKALLRRYCVYQGKDQAEPHHPRPDAQMLELHGVRIALDCNRVWVDEQEADLTETEYKILKLLMQSPQRIFPVQVIYETVWGEPYFYVSNGTVMVHIRNLRMKVEHNPQNPQRICTVWGKGYRFAAQEDGNGNT